MKLKPLKSRAHIKQVGDIVIVEHYAKCWDNRTENRYTVEGGVVVEVFASSPGSLPVGGKGLIRYATPSVAVAGDLLATVRREWAKRGAK